MVGMAPNAVCVVVCVKMGNLVMQLLVFAHLDVRMAGCLATAL